MQCERVLLAVASGALAGDGHGHEVRGGGGGRADEEEPTKCDGVGFLHIFRRNSREKHSCRSTLARATESSRNARMAAMLSMLRGMQPIAGLLLSVNTLD